MEVPLLSLAFFVDLIIDIYFIVDIFFNLNTAIWLENGILETKVQVIRKHYLKGWFTLDLLSSFPLTYLLLIGRLIDGNTRGERNGYQRLLRLAKVARLSRFRRVIKKYEDNGAIGDVTPYLGSIATIFIVTLSGHLLTCSWFYAGMRYGSIVCDPKESHMYADLLERISVRLTLSIIRIVAICKGKFKVEEMCAHVTGSWLDTSGMLAYGKSGRWF